MKTKEDLPVIEAKFKRIAVVRRRKKRTKKFHITKDKFLSETEYEDLSRRVRRCSERHSIILKMYMYTAARANEGLKVRLRDLDYDSKSVYIRANKNSNDRDIPLPHWFFYQLWHYAHTVCKQPDDRIFPFCYTIINRLWHVHKPVKKNFHSLRHTLAIRVFRQSRDIKLVQILLGHKSIMNTMVYLNFVYSQDEMKRILKAKY